MILWRIVPQHRAQNPLSIEGTRRFPGRWNSKGTTVLYVASTETLAILERLVHLVQEHRSIPHVKLKLTLSAKARIDVLDQESAKKVDLSSNDPSATRALGDAWFQQSASLGLQVPSALAMSEHNVLLSSKSPWFKRIKVEAFDPFVFDPRF